MVELTSWVGDDAEAAKPVVVTGATVALVAESDWSLLDAMVESPVVQVVVY